MAATDSRNARFAKPPGCPSSAVQMALNTLFDQSPLSAYHQPFSLSTDQAIKSESPRRAAVRVFASSSIRFSNEGSYISTKFPPNLQNVR